MTAPVTNHARPTVLRWPVFTVGAAGLALVGDGPKSHRNVVDANADPVYGAKNSFAAAVVLSMMCANPVGET